MSLIEILAKWGLDKVDMALDELKDGPSVQERIQSTYNALDEVERVMCEPLKTYLRDAGSDPRRWDKRGFSEILEQLKVFTILSKRRSQRRFLKIFKRPIRQLVEGEAALKFWMDREGLEFAPIDTIRALFDYLNYMYFAMHNLSRLEAVLFLDGGGMGLANSDEYSVKQIAEAEKVVANFQAHVEKLDDARRALTELSRKLDKQ